MRPPLGSHFSLDASGSQYSSQGGYGPDRQRSQTPTASSPQGSIQSMPEDGVTRPGRVSVNLNGGKAYSLVLDSGGDAFAVVGSVLLLH